MGKAAHQGSLSLSIGVAGGAGLLLWNDPHSLGQLEKGQQKG